ncbi:MAG: tRNA (adenosine(37)-N6)-threonylcarbamoyltransferase complex dimerization subunit type 1 TsaB [Rhizobiaceae bacterium]|nr:tRNA (adenosine(37)-N6)-threonylcarbamoyltransferase complex dimerization subunit type 1 TsaB [Rhizobiaceae bacterium]
MLLLAIDTAAAQCAACVFDTASRLERGRIALDLGKGHAERLMEVIDGALAEAGVGYDALGRIAVSIGPGSFTGVRVGVSAARGLALALDVPAIGISTLEAVAAETRASLGDPVLVAFESAGDALQAALYDADGNVLVAPAILDMEDALRLAEQHRPLLAGTAARRIAGAGDLQLSIGSERNTADIGTYARLAATKEGAAEKPKPLYLREPDAKPQSGFVLPRA